MCGISGIVNPGPAAEASIMRIISALQHRGPDQAGIYVDSAVALGHRRLRASGLDGGQPVANEAGTLWIVSNSAVFNYPELKVDLQKKGHRFHTGADAELLLHLYQEYGKRCLTLLNGQFAFAIWDCLKKELFLARDRVGIRPLYYYQRGNRFLFASEIKALLADPSLPREIDPVALHQVFTFWTTLTPRTTFKDVYELPAGQYLVVRDGKIVEQEPFWALPYDPLENRYTGSCDQAVEELRSLLVDAIGIRLRADVPVGAHLSGGLDSSIITSLISRHFNNRLRTFSLGFQEHPSDEALYCRELANYLGTEHSELHISNREIREQFPRVILHCEKPLLRTAPASMFLLSEMVRDRSFKVVLTGEGADEVFGGYDIFKEGTIRQFWHQFPQSLRRPLLLERLHPYIFKDPGRGPVMLQKFYAVREDDQADPFFSHRIGWKNTGKSQLFFSEETLARALAGYSSENELLGRLPEGFRSRDPLSKAQFLEMDIFLTNYLLSSRGDRVAMGNALELRLPFLDSRVIDFAAKLPPCWKFEALNEKHILQRAFRDLLPRVARPKPPYRAPIREVFFSGESGYVDGLLSEEYLRKTRYFHPEKTGRFVDRYRKSGQLMEGETEKMALVGILSTQLLHYHFIDVGTVIKGRSVEIAKRIVRA